MRMNIVFPALAIVLTPLLGHAEAPRWTSTETVRNYHKNSELQRQWAYEALGDLSLGTRDSILDYGCGDGKVTASLSHHAKKAKLVGVDTSTHMIDWAKKKFNTERYPNLAFELSDPDHPIGQKYEEAFDLVVSFSVFDQVENPEAALKDIFLALKRGGTLSMVIPGREGGSTEFKEAFETVKKRHHLDESGRPQMQAGSMRDIETARKLLGKAGFQLARVDIKPRMEPFADKQDFIDWLEGTVVNLWNLPIEEGRELCCEIADEYISRAPEALRPNGSIVVRMAPMHIHANKPRMLWVN